MCVCVCVCVGEVGGRIHCVCMCMVEMDYAYHIDRDKTDYLFSPLLTYAV